MLKESVATDLMYLRC